MSRVFSSSAMTLAMRGSTGVTSPAAIDERAEVVRSPKQAQAKARERSLKTQCGGQDANISRDASIPPFQSVPNHRACPLGALDFISQPRPMVLDGCPMFALAYMGAENEVFQMLLLPAPVGI